MSSDLHHIANKSRRLYFFTYLVAPLGYIVRIMTADTISVEEVGVLYSLIGLMVLMSAYNDLGFGEALIHFFPKLSSPDKHNQRIGLFVLSCAAQLLTSIVIALFLWYGSSWIIDLYLCRQGCSLSLLEQLPTALGLFGFFFLFLNSSEVIGVTLLTHHDTARSQGLGWIRMMTVLVATSWVWFTQSGSLTGFVVIRVLGFGVMVCCGLYRILTHYRDFFTLQRDQITHGYLPLWDSLLIKDFIRYALHSLLGSNAGSILGQLDQQTIIFFVGASMAGYMSMYLSLSQIPSLLLGPILGFVLPLVSTRWVQNNTQGIKTFLSLFVTLFVIAGGGLVFFMIIMAPHIVLALFGPQYTPVTDFLYRGVWIAPIVLINQLFLGTLAGIGSIEERNKLLVIGMLIAMVGNIILVHIMGYRGVLIATALASITILILSRSKLPPVIRSPLNRGLLSHNFMILLLVGLITWFLVPDISSRQTSFVLCTSIGLGRGACFVIFNKDSIRGLRNLAYPPISSDTAHDTTNTMIQQAIIQLTSGSVIGLPTETVYGLAADACNDQAIKDIFNLKNRPSDNPLIIHCDDVAMVQDYAHISHPWEKFLLTRFSPGPFTMVLRDAGRCAPSVTAGYETICVRIPDHPDARSIITSYGKPLAAPSANPSGKPSATTATMVRDYFSSDDVPCIIDGGACEGGIESTIVAIHRDDEGYVCTILRPGLITQEDIEDATTDACIQGQLDPGSYRVVYGETSYTTPGSKYRHYGPRNHIVLISEKQALPDNSILIATQEFWHDYKQRYDNYIHITRYDWGSQKILTECASRLYQLYHECDQHHNQVIYIHTLPMSGLGYAIMNRVYKSISRE